MLTTAFESSLSKTFCACSGGNLSIEVITLAIVCRKTQNKNKVSLDLVTATFDTSRNQIRVSLRQTRLTSQRKKKDENYLHNLLQAHLPPSIRFPINSGDNQKQRCCAGKLTT